MNKSIFRRALVLPITVALGLASSLSHAASLTRTSSFDYDPSTGLLTKEVIEPANSNLCLVTVYTYDGYGNKTGATTRNCNGSAGTFTGAIAEAGAPSGDAVIASRTSSTSFDARGQFPTSSTNALSQTETRTFNANFGTVKTLTGPNSLVTAWAYDSFGRKTAEQRADGNGTKWDYQYCSGVNGGSATCPTINGVAGVYVVVATPVAAPIVINADGTLASTGSQNGAISKTYYDALNRAIRSETQGYDGTGSSTAIYQDTQYDSLGRVSQTSRPYYTGQTVYWTSYTYDAISRVIAVTTPPDGTSTNTSTSTSYNGLSVTVTNANNQSRTTTKNSQGQVVSVTDALNQTLSYYYDPFGNLVQTLDVGGNATSLAYDLRGRKTLMSDPDMGLWSYAYNALGQLIRQLDAKGNTSTLTYDLLGRMTNRSEADLVSNWYYDTYKGGGACNKGIGKLCQSETSTGYSKVVSYDSLGRYSSASTTIDVPTPYTDSVTYDANGRVLTQTYPTGFVASFTYTGLGYLKQVTNGGSTTYWTANTLDAEGHLLQQTYGNGVVTQQTYNAANGRITGIVAGAGNGVQNFTYAYDNLGNILTRTDGNQSLTENFAYDSLNRVTSAQINANPAVTYTYGGLGKVLSRSDLGTYTYPANGASSVHPHAVSNIAVTAGGNITVTYDANGNLSTFTQTDANNNVIAAKSRSEFYTSFNMPNSLGAGGISEAFYYGSEHQRVKQISSGHGTTIYLNPDNNGSVFFEKDIHPDNSTEQRHFLTAYGQVVAIVKLTNGSTWSAVYLHRDNLNSTTTITDASGNVIERLAYEPFGKRRFPNGASDPNNTIAGQNTVRGFTNHEMLDELELVHMNGRIYDPTLARFMSPDPNIPEPGNLQSYDRYAYVLNNPLIYTDPSGYCSLFSLGGNGCLRHWENVIARNPILQIGVTIAAWELAPYISGYTGWTGGVATNVAGEAVTIDGGLSAAIGITNSTIASNMMGGFVAGYLTSDGSLKQASISALTAGAFTEVGDLTNGHNPGRDYFNTPDFYENVAGHAVVGCASAAASGGSCGRGALSAGVADFFTPLMSQNRVYGFVEVTVIGGTASVLGGGKFSNGAMTASFGYLYNAWSDDSHSTEKFSDSRQGQALTNGIGTIADATSNASGVLLIGCLAATEGTCAIIPLTYTYVGSTMATAAIKQSSFMSVVYDSAITAISYAIPETRYILQSAIFVGGEAAKPYVEKSDSKQ